MAKLFREIGRNHGTSGEEVRRSLGRRRVSFDLSVMLSFAVLYGWGASLVARWLCRVYGPREGLITVAVMTVLAALLLGVAAVMVGEAWSLLWEMYRLGNGHMSYRAERIPWVQHRVELFVAAIAVFLLIAGFHRRRATTKTPVTQI